MNVKSAKSARGSARGLTLRVVLLLLVLLVCVGVAGWWQASEHLTAAGETRTALEEARKELDALAKRPMVQDHESATADLAEAQDELARTKAALVEKTEALDEETVRGQGLRAKLDEAERTGRELSTEIGGLRARAEGLAAANKRLTADLEAATQRYETAREAASGKANLLDKLEAADKKASDLDARLAEAQSRVAEKEARLDKAAEDLQKATSDIEERDEQLSKLKVELAEIPIMPLPDALAEQKYRDYLNLVAEYTEREQRVATLFRAKLALAGSSYETKADAAWRKEMRRRQEDVERAAKAVYGEVTSKIRIHSDAHDENVKLLAEALEKVTGSRYEKIIQQLIDREHELKAVGR